MSLFDALVLGLVEGLTEFIPVSSTGHLIVARELFGLSSAYGLSVDALLQFATLLAIVLYFKQDLFRMCMAGVSYVSGKHTASSDRAVFLALLAGTVPAVIFGLLLEDTMATVFRNADLVATMLIVGSLLFFFAEWVHTTYGPKEESTSLSLRQGFVIGLFQSLALIPGVSRSGAAISGGLILGLSRVEATRFAFLLSIPIIAGSGLKKLIDLGADGVLGALGPSLFAGMVVAFVTGLLAIHFMLRFLKTHTLIPFALYRIALGVCILFFL